MPPPLPASSSWTARWWPLSHEGCARTWFLRRRRANPLPSPVCSPCAKPMPGATPTGIARSATSTTPCKSPSWSSRAKSRDSRRRLSPPGSSRSSSPNAACLSGRCSTTFRCLANSPRAREPVREYMLSPGTSGSTSRWSGCVIETSQYQGRQGRHGRSNYPPPTHSNALDLDLSRLQPCRRA